MADVAYTLVYNPNPAGKTTVSEYRTLLEKGRDESKIDAMKQILVTMLDGNPMPELLMHVIRYVMPSRNNELKKLLYFYWEIVPKVDTDGKLKQEMILVCNAIQRDLQHPNEYIRGNTLRFLTKLHETELLEQLVPSARACLEHRHAYVRKYAIFAIYSIYLVSDHLIPDAPEIINDFLITETDPTCKRNAFIALGNLDRNAALRYIQENVLALSTIDPLLQLAFIEFIRKDKAPELRTRYINLLSELLDSPSNSVVYEAATSLTQMTSNPSFVILAANKFIELAIKESDNNVKLIVLERIQDIHEKNPGVLEDVTLDILRILTSPDLDIRKKAIDLSLELTSSRNVDEILKLYKKELQKTVNSDADKSADYRQLLISAIHQTALKFASVAATDVVDLLLEFLPELSTVAATDILSFIKEIIEKYPDLRSGVISRLTESLENIRSGKVFRGALWILGEYCLDEKDIQSAWKHIRACVGDVPILQAEKKKHGDTEETTEEAVKLNGHKPLVLPDGTYATESALTTDKIDKKEESRPPLRQFIFDGEFYTSAVLASAFVKLILRFEEVSDKANVLNALKAESMLILVSILRVGGSSYVKTKIDEDSHERIMTAITYIAEGDANKKLLEVAFLDATRDAYRVQLAVEDKKKAKRDAAELQKNVQQADEVIQFRQFGKVNTIDAAEEDLTAATGLKVQEDLSSRLNKIVQLTGFSDPVYAEAYVKVHQFDVVLDVLLVNQTTETLRNLHVEFATLGDLKLIDKPTTQNIPAHGFFKVQTTIKVTSADTGVIFGNIVYDGGHGAENKIVILNDVHVDIMDYIKPGKCSETKFRAMWDEFEWENKIVVKSSLSSLKEYLDELLKGTNMACLTPGAVIGEECQFLSANLYSRSSFGEDALANLCIEKQPDGPIIGHVRIRSKGQGLALSMGDRVAAIARKTNKVLLTHV